MHKDHFLILSISKCEIISRCIQQIFCNSSYNYIHRPTYSFGIS